MGQVAIVVFHDNVVGFCLLLTASMLFFLSFFGFPLVCSVQAKKTAVLQRNTAAPTNNWKNTSSLHKVNHDHSMVQKYTKGRTRRCPAFCLKLFFFYSLLLFFCFGTAAYFRENALCAAEFHAAVGFPKTATRTGFSADSRISPKT